MGIFFSKNQIHLRLLAVLLLPLFTLLCSGAEGDDIAAKKKIFILHSYEKNHVCGQPQHNGVVQALEEEGFVTPGNLTVATYYMDTKKKNNTPELITKQAEIAKNLIDEFKPDLLITLDDNAFSKVGLQYAGTGLPVVFCGVNGQPEDYSKRKPFLKSRETPGSNITGVYEKLHIADALRIQMKILPKMDKLLIIVDNSPTGKAINKQIELELSKEKDLRPHWTLKVVENWEQYQKAVSDAGKNPQIGAIYPVALLLRDQKGKTYTAPDIFKWTIANSTKPELALNYAFTRLGLFGGAAVDFKAMGHQAGLKAAKILIGIKPGSIPIEDARRFALSFNMKRANQLGIQIPSEILLATDEIVK